MVKTLIDIPEVLKQELKVACVTNNTTIREVVIGKIKDYVDDFRTGQH